MKSTILATDLLIDTMPEVFDTQRKVKIPSTAIRKFVDGLTSVFTEAKGKQFDVAFVSDRRMIELNKLFRGKDLTTDVLSFPNEPDEFSQDENNLGDIVISAEQAQRQGAENGLDLETEIKQLILHGLLHLLGYDHETDNGEMNARELELRPVLGID